MNLTEPAQGHKKLNSIELIRRRRAAGMSQRVLALKIAEITGKVNLAQQYIAHWESLKTPDIPVEYAEALEKIFPG
ncbi:MAG: helix-turn-helix transcriptional regulator [Phycisphaerae bacterium]|nr:helix-turn-helix transcriptional regulator [Phycisphaerae bacterium]